MALWASAIEPMGQLVERGKGAFFGDGNASSVRNRGVG